MFIKRNGSKPSAKEAHTFPERRPPLAVRLKTRVAEWLADQVPLFEAFCVALSLHVLAFPFMWFIGWSLPWPKSPTFTTVIELNLENWPNEALPEKVTETLRTHFKD